MIKSQKEVTKTIGIKVFLTIFAWWEKDPDPDPGGPKTYGRIRNTASYQTQPEVQNDSKINQKRART